MQKYAKRKPEPLIASFPFALFQLKMPFIVNSLQSIRQHRNRKR